MRELYSRKVNSTTAGMKRNHKNVQTDPELHLQRPLFNIHIHVPAYSMGNFQMYLPRLQPIVHVHFDEIAKKLEIRKGQNEATTYSLFKSLVAMTSPTYGDVKFYTSHMTGDGQFRESQILPTSVTTTTINSECIPTGIGPSIYQINGNLPNSITVRSNNCEGSSSVSNFHQSTDTNINQKDRNKRKRTMSELEKEFKLKKAVVVLTDICKSKYYKNLLKKSKEQRIEESHNGLDRTENEQYNSQPFEKVFIKTEIESPEPVEESVLPLSNKDGNEASIESPKPVEEGLSLSNKVGSVESKENVNYDVAKSLTSLVEGCNFSEILHRFKVKKCEEHLVDSVKNAPTFKNNSEKNYDCETSEQGSYHENKFMNNETQEGDNVPSGIKSEPTVKEDFDETVSNDETKEIPTSVDDLSNSLNASTDTQSDIDHSLLSNDRELEDDDENEVPKIVSNQKIIRATSNSEIEILSCGTSPFLIPVNRFQFLRSDENTDYKSNIDLQLELIKEEMARRNIKTYTRSKNSGKGVKKTPMKSPSEGKKSKDSKEQKTDNSSQTDNYIPLQATGPTRFAVAPLNKVSPYKSHDARNFRNDMLFGNRVNRFQSGDQLRVYRAKKNVGKRLSG